MKTKKILSVVLSLLMIFGVFSIVASAENAAIDSADITFDLDIAGIDADDYHEYVTILTEGLAFEENYGDPGVFVDDWYGNSFHDEFVEGETYYFYIYLTPEEGYEFADIVEGSINGEDYDTYVDGWYPDSSIYGDVYVPYVQLYCVLTVGEDSFGGSDADLINTAEIEITTDLAGYYVDDYEYYIDILTDNLEFEDNYGDPAVFVFDEYGNLFEGEFESGETYSFIVCLSPMAGYQLDSYVDSYVNGEWCDSTVDTWYPDDAEVQYVAIEFELTVDGEKEFNFFDFIASYFAELYYKFLLMFMIWFM